MNPSSSSSSAHLPRRPSIPTRPSLPHDRRLSRRFSTISRTESGHNVDISGPTSNTEHQLTEEIEEIKRYEDFTTIDWVQDAAREQLRRRARRQANEGSFEREGSLRWRQKLRESYDAGQAWIVVTLVGAAIGLNAGILNIVTEWLSDIKLGYCTTGFYLNENFCCWGEENGGFFLKLVRRDWNNMTDRVQGARTGIDGVVFGRSITSFTSFSL